MSTVPRVPDATRDEELAREVRGPARLGRRTKVLTKRLKAGDIAILDHQDLDRVSAEDLVGLGVAAVLNCKPSFRLVSINRRPLPAKTSWTTWTCSLPTMPDGLAPMP